MQRDGLHLLDEAVGTLTRHPLARHELAAALHLRDRLDHLLAREVGVLHRRGDALLDGVTSTGAWLRHHGRLTHGDAARLLRVGTALASLPVTDQALSEGRLSMAQADQVVRGVGHRVEAFARAEHQLVPLLDGLSPQDTGTVARHWAMRHDAEHHTPAPAPSEQPEPEPLAEPEGEGPGASCDCPPALPPEPSTLAMSPLLDTWALDGTLSADDGLAVRAAIDLFAPKDPNLSPGARRAAGLVAACRFALDHRAHARTARHRPHLVLHVHTTREAHEARDAQAATAIPLGPAVTDHGQVLPAAVTARHACDAVVSRLVRDQHGHVLHYGRRTRVVPTGLAQAVHTRDRHCRFPGCDRPASWCDIHHVVPWSQGGPTNLTNLALLCAHHHTVVHQPGWSTAITPCGELHVTTAWGERFSSHPPPW